MGGSVLLIAASAVALALGWANADEVLIWTSITASSAAAVMLALAYFRSRSAPAPGAAGDVAGLVPRGQLSEGGRIVAVPERKKYHREECRYAMAGSAVGMSVARARSEGYTPCGVCKP